MSWEKHSHQVNLKISKGIGISSQMRHFVYKEILVNLYNALLKPHIDYSLLAWGNLAKTHVTKLERNQRKVLRIMNFKKRRETCDDVFKKFKILPVKDMIKKIYVENLCGNITIINYQIAYQKFL